MTKAIKGIITAIILALGLISAPALTGDEQINAGGIFIYEEKTTTISPMFVPGGNGGSGGGGG